MKNLILFLILCLSYFCKAQSPTVTINYKETYETNETVSVSQSLNESPKIYLNGCSNFKLDSITIIGSGKMTLFVKTGEFILSREIVDRFTIYKQNPFNGVFKMVIIVDNRKIFNSEIIMIGCN